MSRKPTSVRLAIPSDSSVILKLSQQLYDSTSGDKSQDFHLTEDFIRTRILSDNPFIPLMKCWIAETSDDTSLDACGYVITHSSFEWEGLFLHLDQIYSLEEAAEVLKILLKQVIQYALSVDASRVEVVPCTRNVVLCDLLKSYGFRDLSSICGKHVCRLQQSDLMKLSSMDIPETVTYLKEQPLVTAGDLLDNMINGGSKNITIRWATENDCGSLFRLIHELAAHLRTPFGDVVVTEAMLKQHGFRTNSPIFKALLVEQGSNSVGYALFTPSLGFCGSKMFLVDIYVHSSLRNKGVGKSLFKIISDYAVDIDCTAGIDLHYVDWNLTAFGVYKRLGFVDVTAEYNLHVWRLNGAALSAFRVRKQ